MIDVTTMTPQERAMRALDNRLAITRFLRDEIFTDSEVLAQVLGLSHVSSVNKILNSMASAGLLIKHRLPSKKLIWGITASGALFSYQEEEDAPVDFKTFRASKFNALTFEHKKALQKIRLQTQKIGWENWQTFPIVSGRKSPDGLVLWPEKGLVAIEYEKTIKASKRYDGIIRAHLEAIVAKRYKKVFYVCPNESITGHVKRIFTKQVGRSFVVQGRSMVLTENAFLSIFRFYSLEHFLRTKKS
ncbi:hypothetical protein [Vibrio algivorus]|uniref:Mobilization protein n=1 Tax=Vibrio algivorus TaxID=1667024 RepID=A0A557NUV6_9VIBR|nr:hypothetical protein [Vibrio algivorus]TVO32105.1 hypothetical protein FOF44_17450 [Vibrio algivorus]